MKCYEENEACILRLTPQRFRTHSCEILPINEGPGIIKLMGMKMKARKLNNSKLTTVKNITL